MTIYKLFISIVITATLCVILIMVLGTNNANANNSTQQYQDSRYALINAPISVRSEFDGSAAVSNSVVKVDTATGKVWVLQMTIASPQNPSIVSAEFIPIQTKFDKIEQNSY